MDKLARVAPFMCCQLGRLGAATHARAALGTRRSSVGRHHFDASHGGFQHGRVSSASVTSETGEGRARTPRP